MFSFLNCPSSPTSPQSWTPIHLLHNSQRKRRDNTKSDNSPTSRLDLLIRDHRTHIPNQMPDTIERVVRERERKRELGKNLERSRPSGKRSGQAGALEVPADERRGQVRGAEDVEGAAQHAARDAVQRAAVPCDLWLVDAQVRRHGPVQALLGEDLVVRCLL